MSLANKYRPKFLKDLKGQEIVVKFLSHLIQNNISKNIIFKGEFGTGKTTSARIYAKAMLCSDKKSNLEACEKCESCITFESNSNRDYLEFDAASKGAVENIRQLLDAFNAPPTFSQKKIWVIDEAHSMSPKAWDTLLKTIEEPKSFQIVLFCTNYPEKIRPAILSRCIILELRKLNEEESNQLIKQICLSENLKIDSKSINIISYFSNGHSRDILKNLEQLSYLGDINGETTFQVLVGDKYKSVIEIYKCIISNSFTSKLNESFNLVIDFKKEFEILMELILYLKSSMIYGHKLTSLSIIKIFHKAELAELDLNTRKFCKESLLSINDFFSRIDIALSSSNINSNIEFKFLIFSICESINKEILKINTDALKTFSKNKGRRFTKKDNQNSEENENSEKIEIEEKDIEEKDIEEQDVELSINVTGEKKIENVLQEKINDPPIESEILEATEKIIEKNFKKVFSHELYSKYNFTKQVNASEIILL